MPSPSHSLCRAARTVRRSARYDRPADRLDAGCRLNQGRERLLRGGIVAANTVMTPPRPCLAPDSLAPLVLRQRARRLDQAKLSNPLPPASSDPVTCGLYGRPPLGALDDPARVVGSILCRSARACDPAPATAAMLGIF